MLLASFILRGCRILLNVPFSGAARRAFRFMPVDDLDNRTGDDGSGEAQLNLFSPRPVELTRPTLDKGRRAFRWPREARDLVRGHLDASGPAMSVLLTEVEAISGNPRWACRRFMRGMGVKSKRLQRAWTAVERQRLLKLLDLHPISEIARILRRSQSSIRHTLQRMGANARMGTDSFTAYTLATALHVRPEKIQEWIARGWLKAREVETLTGKRSIIAAEDFCEFCRQRTREAVGNRLTKERLEFVYRFAFPPSHAELLPVRESKKERGAYFEQVKKRPAAERRRPAELGGGSDERIDRSA